MFQPSIRMCSQPEYCKILLKMYVDTDTILLQMYLDTLLVSFKCICIGKVSLEMHCRYGALFTLHCMHFSNAKRLLVELPHFEGMKELCCRSYTVKGI